MNQSPKKRSEPAKKIGGGSLPLATASSPRAAASSATPSNGGHPRNAPGKLRKEEQYKNEPWPHIEIQDACEFIVDCVNKTAPVVDHKTPYRMIRTTNVREGRINLEECRYVTEDTYLRWTRRATVEDGDVLLTREAPIGEVGYAEGLGKVFLGQRIMQYRSRPSILQPRFLFYSFQSHTLTSQFSAHEGSGSVVSHIRVGDCFKFRVPLPPLPIQQRIASILGTLDDKIALNRRINQTLEAMAQALFQSWFVDFDPVKAKQKILGAGGTAREAELAAMQIISGKNPHQLKTFQQAQPQQYAELEHTAKLFPNRLVESELGLVPEGWEVTRIDSLLCLEYGKSLSKTERKNGLVPVYGSGGVTGNHDQALVSGPGIIIGRKGTVGSLYWEDQDFFPIDTTFYVVPKSGISLSFSFYLLQTLELQNMNTDAAVPGLNRNNVYRLEVPKYSNETIATFATQADVLRQKIKVNNYEFAKLIDIRDSLLPKLLSGEISVENIGELQS